MFFNMLQESTDHQVWGPTGPNGQGHRISGQHFLFRPERQTPGKHYSRNPDNGQNPDSPKFIQDPGRQTSDRIFHQRTGHGQ